MMRKTTILIFLLFSAFGPLWADQDIYHNAVILFKTGDYEAAAGELEKTKDKDSKIYYYLGLSYFKAGKKDLAKNRFLRSYYYDPGSKWGKSSYKNYLYLVRYKWNFYAYSGFSYDSNVSYLPEELESSDSGSWIADTFVRSSFRFSTPGRLHYSYKRMDYFNKEIPDEDIHKLGTAFLSGTDTLVLLISYSTLGGENYYLSGFTGYTGSFFRLGALLKTYADEYDYLDGYELSLTLFRSISGIQAEYSFLYNGASDISGLFVYDYSEDSIASQDISFEEYATDKNYSVSYSYMSNSLGVEKYVPLGRRLSLKFSPYYQVKTYTGKTVMYYNYWLYDTDSGRYYYFSETDNRWVPSDDAPPGVPLDKMRVDSKITLRLSLNFRIRWSLHVELFDTYEIKRSNIGNGDIYDYNWEKNTSGIRFYANF